MEEQKRNNEQKERKSYSGEEMGQRSEHSHEDLQGMKLICMYTTIGNYTIKIIYLVGLERSSSCHSKATKENKSDPGQ